ncbi:hypothetical protein GFL58_19195 [Rhizobium leguminosarum bv. viciae]|uniref:hypothetical protein n=1 Tax=Rhizobium leguminosarum TaxID=384 RepID=UPI00143F3277|nr:hypothetical protein [Rhizobium leguminosarum]NKM63097.1 hypothetical protein [Rhizobium leguminosarum bv. viciae]
MSVWKNQLSGDYLRDRRSRRGVFLLIYRGEKRSWQYPDGTVSNSFRQLVEALTAHWRRLGAQYPNVEDLKVIGIDLTARHRAMERQLD